MLLMMIPRDKIGNRSTSTFDDDWRYPKSFLLLQSRRRRLFLSYFCCYCPPWLSCFFFLDFYFLPLPFGIVLLLLLLLLLYVCIRTTIVMV